MMKGWKTWSAVAGLVMTGITQIIAAINGEGGSIMDGVTTIIGALALVGIGHKVEKNGTAADA